jgi:hypothetical protein
MAHKLRMVGPANKVRKVHKVYKVRMERILLVADKKLVDYRRLPSFWYCAENDWIPLRSTVILLWNSIQLTMPTTMIACDAAPTHLVIEIEIEMEVGDRETKNQKIKIIWNAPQRPQNDSTDNNSYCINHHVRTV